MSDHHIDSDIYFHQASNLSNPRNFPKASVAFSRAALQKSQSNPPFLYLDWGNALSSQWKYKAAISKYKISAQLSPNFSYVHNHCGFALLNLGNFDEAAKKFQKAHELDPNGLLFNTNWSLSLYLTGDEPRAVETLKKGLKTNGPYSRWGPKGLKVFYETHLYVLEGRKERARNEREAKLHEKTIAGTKWLVEMLSSE